VNLHVLTKADGDNPLDGVEILKVGLAWERVTQPGETSGIGKAKGWLQRKQREAQGATDPADMDAGAVFFTGDKPVKYLGFGNETPFKDEMTTSEQRSATTTGDSIQGDGDGDDETLIFELRNIPARFDRFMVLVGGYKPGSKMSAVRDLKATVYDGTGGTAQAVAVIEPSLLESHEMLAIADVKKVDGRWLLTVNGSGFTPVKGDIRSLLTKSINVLGR
jgi:stress response protein SCP2